MGAGWGELKVGPCGTLDRTVPGLPGEVGCVRGQALSCMERAAELGRMILPKRKRPSGALWGIPLQQQLQSPLHPATHLSGECAHRLGSVFTSSWKELRPQAPTGDCVYRLGSAYTSSKRKLRPQALGRVQIKEGSARKPIA